MEGLTDTLRLELRKTPIKVVLIEPGPIRTAIREKARARYEMWINKENSFWREQYETIVERRLYDPNPAKDRWELGPEAVTDKLIRGTRKPKTPRTILRHHDDLFGVDGPNSRAGEHTRLAAWRALRLPAIRR